MLIDSSALRFESIRELVFVNETKNKNFFVILLKKSFIEIFKIRYLFEPKLLKALNSCKKIIKTKVFFDEPTKKLNLIFFDENHRINLIDFNQKWEAKIISSKNLFREFSSNKIYYIFLLILKHPFVCLISTTNGIKILLKIKKTKNNKFRFLNQGLKVIQGNTVCYYIANLKNVFKSYFVCIESHSKLPYSRFLVFYNYNNKGILKKKILSRIDPSAYKIFIFPKKGSNGGNLIILSRKKISIINYKKKIQISESFPFKKIKRKYFIPQIIDFCIFNGEKKSLLFFFNRQGDLFRFAFNFNIDNYLKYSNLKIQYFDTISAGLKNIKILPNGILFVTFETGKNAFYRFINVKNKIPSSDLHFIPNRVTKNIMLLNEFSLISKILPVSFENLLKKYSKRIIFFSGTKNQSTLHFLDKISHSLTFFQKKLKFKPFGLFIMETDENCVNFFVSFKLFTISFLFHIKIEEVNNLKIITDSKTISVFFSIYFKGTIQITNKIVRLVKKINGNTKLFQWICKPGVFIRNIAQNLCQKPYIILFLSNNKIIILEFTEKDVFLELKSWVLNNLKENSLLINCYISSEQTQPKILIISAKRERTIRIYRIFSNLSLTLIGIQLLNWSLESIMVIKDKKDIFFLFALNNGTLLKTIFCQKKNRINFLFSLNISSYPLYFPENFSPKNPLLFGEKVWKLNDFWKDDFDSSLILNHFFDLFEFLGKFIIVSRKKTLKILFNREKSNFFLNKFELALNCKVQDACYIGIKKDRNFILILNPPEELENHEMNLVSAIDQKKFYLNDYKNNSQISNVSILTFPKKIFSKRGRVGNISSLFKIRTSSSNFNLNSIIMKKSQHLNKYVFFLSRFFHQSHDHPKKVFSILDEYSNKTVSIMVIILRKYNKFISIIGGKYRLKLRLDFVFERLENYQFYKIKKDPLSKSFMGSRFILLYEKEIKLIEVSKETIKVFHTLNIPTFNLARLKTIGNTLYIIENFKGIKILEFFKKGHLIKGHKLIENFSTQDFFILNPLFFILKDFFQNFYIYVTKKNQPNSYFKKKKKVGIVKMFFKLENLKKICVNLFLNFSEKFLIDLLQEVKFPL